MLAKDIDLNSVKAKYGKTHVKTLLIETGDVVNMWRGLFPDAAAQAMSRYGNPADNLRVRKSGR